MKIEIGENNSLLVFLDKKDVNAMQLDLSNAVEENAAAREILERIYLDAAHASGFVPHSTSSKVIEILPFQDGSALICFSFRQKRVKMKVTAIRKRDFAVYEFSDVNCLEQFLNHAQRLQELPEAVYEKDGCYRFIVRSDCKSLDNLLKEFAHRRNVPFACERTAEYWRKVYS